MDLEVLIATMNLTNEKEHEKLIQQMRIKTPSLTINQITELDSTWQIEEGINKCFSYMEKGLSKSRNKAISLAKEEIIIFADEDVIYENNYSEIIQKAYEQNPNVDGIAFYVESLNKNRPVRKLKNGKIGFLKTMRVSSFQLTFRRKALLKNEIQLEEAFGAGAIYNRGEETILLCDCLAKGLKLQYCAEKIATVKQENSTWFTRI